jgi:hypothetical protein
MTESEKLILEFYVLTSEINELKNENSEKIGHCEDLREDKDFPVCAITCIDQAFKDRKASSGIYGETDFFGDLCPNCRIIINNSEERKTLNAQRGYVKNKMHNLAKRLIKRRGQE